MPSLFRALPGFCRIITEMASDKPRINPELRFLLVLPGNIKAGLIPGESALPVDLHAASEAMPFQ
ncbi:MAG: hypothetical protein R3C17_10350 [Planctomycetaceae bacterium]